jgi:hypothetical protein
MRSEIFYKSDAERKRLDKWLRGKLLREVMGDQVRLSTTRESHNILKERAGQLSRETLRLIVLSMCFDLFGAVMHVVPVDILQEMLHKEDFSGYDRGRVLNCLTGLPKETVQQLIPDLLAIVKHNQDNLNGNSIVELLEYSDFWEAGRHIKIVAQHITQHDNCDHKLFLELVTRYPDILSEARWNDMFWKAIVSGKLALVKGENYEVREEPAAELQRTGDSV